MPRDKTVTHGKILAAAKQEFLEYGFESASMRRIGERCGMTAAGIYRHCRDKADLFDQVVAPAVEQLQLWLNAHETRYLDAVQQMKHVSWQDSEIDMMREIVYPHMDDYQLLLNCAQGTRYETFLHDLTQVSQENLLNYLPVPDTGTGSFSVLRLDNTNAVLLANTRSRRFVK